MIKIVEIIPEIEFFNKYFILVGDFGDNLLLNFFFLATVEFEPWSRDCGSFTHQKTFGKQNQTPHWYKNQTFL